MKKAFRKRRKTGENHEIVKPKDDYGEHQKLASP